MRKPHVGEKVIVRLALPNGQTAPPRGGTLVGQGRDSGGPYMLVEWPDGERDLVHPHRVQLHMEAK